MLVSRAISFGKLDCTIYDAIEVGDILPMHTHEEGNVHITIISRGSFKVHGDGWEMISKEGDVIDWEIGQAHEFVALQPNSRFVNIIK
jgi:quercetin dioxygenase-like cupin family protein